MVPQQHDYLNRILTVATRIDVLDVLMWKGKSQGSPPLDKELWAINDY